MKMKKPFSLQLDVSDFLPAGEDEKQSLSVARPAASFWKDGMRRLRKNIVAMISLAVIVLFLLLAFVVPAFYPYSYEQQVRGSENLAPFAFSETEQVWQKQGREFTLSVLLPPDTGLEKIALEVRYDPAMLEFVSARKGIVLDTKATFTDTPGIVRMEADSKEPVNKTGAVMNVTFRCTPGAALGETQVTATAPVFETAGGSMQASVHGNSAVVLPRLAASPQETPATAPTLQDGKVQMTLSGAQVQKGESIFPHLLGTDALGRDLAIRVMIGSRISLLVGLIASAIILIIGSIYGAIAGYFGGKVDMVMMRLVDLIYTVPDILIIILLMVTLKFPLQELAGKVSWLSWINTVGVGLISIFVVFALLYWVGMARIVRGQVLTLKEQEYVTASRALGARSGRIIRKHLLTNCVGTLIVTTTLQIPASIFTESFLSFLGLGVSAPMPSLGSLAAQAIGGITSYPHRLLAPAVMISLMILAFNLLGDGLRDAFDPKLKKE